MEVENSRGKSRWNGERPIQIGFGLRNIRQGSNHLNTEYFTRPSGVADVSVRYSTRNTPPTMAEVIDNGV